MCVCVCFCPTELQASCVYLPYTYKLTEEFNNTFTTGATLYDGVARATLGSHEIWKKEARTRNLKARKKPRKDVLAGVGHRQRAELRHQDAVLLRVCDVGGALQEAAAVGDSAVADVEAMHHGHAVEPVGVTEGGSAETRTCDSCTLAYTTRILKKSPIPIFPKLKLPGSVSEEAAVDPRRDVSPDGARNGVRGLLRRGHQGRHGLQPFGLRASLPARD